jgi:hypothetical protein
MKNQIPLMLLIGGVGIIIGLMLQGRDETESASANAPSEAANIKTNNTDKEATPPQTPGDAGFAQLQDELYELTALRELMQKEVQARKDLETQVAKLSKRIKTLESGDAQTTETGETTESALTTTTVSTNNTRQGVTRPGWINEQAMIDAGLDPSEATRIRDIYENVEMERLYLRDQAIREGWIGDERYRTEREQLNARLESLRDELNDDAYDAFLYATGRPNRVVVQSTLRTSPARDSGIKSGDSVIRYDNMRVYTWSDLREATTQCQTGAVVEVELERNGKRTKVFVPCGPMGVRLDNASVQPGP